MKIKYFFWLFAGIILVFFFSFKSALAATLPLAKDTISTSRPSVSTTLNVGVSSGISQVIINTPSSNAGRFIASDSAYLIGAPGANETLTVASMSAIAGNTAALYFSSALTGNHNIGASAMTAVTAQHIVSFKNVSAIPAGGSIQMLFPVGNSSAQSLPSPNGFSFNNLVSGNLSATFSPTGPTCSSWTITPSSGLIQCNIGTGVTGVSTITLNIGLTGTNPVLINPTKTAVAGTADTWTVTLKTKDNSGVEMDTAKVRIATIDSVEVYATVDPYINFSIAGIANATAINTGNTSGCTNTELINTGIDSTTTAVNLGSLGAAQINLAAQLLTIATNGNNGYSLTATASGHLVNPETAYWVADAQGTPTTNDTPVPVVLTAGTTAYGIHSCGQDIAAGTWGTGTTGGGANAKYANPSATYYYTLASDTTGPIGSGSGDGYGDGLVSVEYAATISTIVPAGTYRTAMTYVATATF
ncbi:hypothetical protein COS54_01065 [Candidatus Shapirobacteria bacterium CG03_land_8_20_14_0_80_39_12]|uniref:Uncharacterized protein n=1 Tax=Candidatus Shapirobacteria bacterium CG03_land_8_20_14_0_80_39_12 TaxID=1974879 RepID=A0A2M7BEB3_9BACT|nr:MAG: hypothetical protein COS54_01065 [Candidatus Shapirobacteria bacterium CG03_land_8_20_14_0_80_39_12]